MMVISASPMLPGPGRPWPFRRILLAVGQPGRDLDVDLLAGGQVHAPGAAGGRFLERDGHGNGDIAAGRLAHILRLEATAEGTGTPMRPAETTEHLADDILEIGAARAAAPLGAFGAERERLEMGVGAGRARPGTRAVAREALKARLALGIDLAGVKRLALLLFAENS